ncbi:unnamed protein product [Penicillium viridicatum]
MDPSTNQILSSVVLEVKGLGIQIWANPGGDSIQAIRMTWATEPSTHRTIGSPSGTPTEITLAASERVTSMKIWASDAVHKIEITTEGGQVLQQGADGGEIFEMEVGSGFLAGLQGAANSNTILRLGPYFFEPYALGRTHNAQVGLA